MNIDGRDTPPALEQERDSSLSDAGASTCNDGDRPVARFLPCHFLKPRQLDLKRTPSMSYELERKSSAAARIA
jgi:hypothetical protein